MRQIGLIVGLVSVVLTVVAPPVPGQAQSPSEATVPLEFVEVLSRSTIGPGLPDVMVGRIPDHTARVVPLPDDGRIIGSLVYPAFAMSAVAVPGSMDAVLDEWAERLLDAEWTRYEFPSHGGFESSPAERVQFCMDDSVSLHLAVSENPRGGTYVSMTHSTEAQRSICQYRGRSPVQGHESLIPTLSPPTGAVVLGSGAVGGGGEQETSARIRTDLSVDELVDHYGSRLRDHGWEVQARTSGPGAASEVFRVADAQGAAWHGVLVASAPAGDGPRFVSLRLLRVDLGY